jgi:putative tricarboxylic transport membrane protein
MHDSGAPWRGQYPRRVSRRRLLAVLLAAALLAPAACARADRHQDLRIMVPNAPGGGYDTTARVAAQVLEDDDTTDHVEIFNLEGASGVVGLARTAHETGNPDLLMMMGLGVVGALFTTDAAVDFGQVTPVARLISEPEIVAVPSGSQFGALGDLLRAWRAHPHRIRVGGGSSPGGPDHLAAHLLAKAVGVDPLDVRYHQYDGGGPLLAALFTGRVDFAVSGVSEYADQIRAGEVKVLAVTGRERVPGLDAPTLRQLGVDLDFANWRGMVAPPGLTEEERRSLVELLTRLHDSPAWRRAEQANGWSDDFLTGPAFGRFLDHESRRVADLLDELGIGARP